MDPRLVPAVPAARYTPPITILSLFKDKYNTTMYNFTLLYKCTTNTRYETLALLSIKAMKEYDREELKCGKLSRQQNNPIH
jgi:hypothetical protein